MSPLHSWLFSGSPVQPLPPHDGSGSLHCLLADCEPVPQLVEQSSQTLHMLQPPFSRKKNYSKLVKTKRGQNSYCHRTCRFRFSSVLVLLEKCTHCQNENFWIKSANKSHYGNMQCILKFNSFAYHFINSWVIRLAKIVPPIARVTLVDGPLQRGR